jgi:phospholipid transport system substrate-binding protein
MRLTRRRAGSLVAAGVTLYAAGLAELVQAQGAPTVAEAVKLIEQSGDKMATILNGPGDWSSKRPQVAAMINETVDVYGVAKFSLGRFWKTASAEQQSECARLFANVLLGSVGRAIGAYRGVIFTVGRATQAGNYVEVRTTVVRPSDQPREVIWVIGSVNGVPKIVDVVAEGTSMRITQRDDTSSFLSHNNYSIPALIETLRQRSELTS